jgi:hypothetical protein
MIAAIPPGKILEMWPIIGPGIERCLAKGVGLQSAAGIRTAASKGEVMLLTASRQGVHLATIVTTVTDGAKRVFEVGLAWGNDLPEWDHDMEKTILELARQLKCDSVAITGRRGWVRHLKNRGFTEKMVTVTRDL